MLEDWNLMEPFYKYLAQNMFLDKKKIICLIFAQIMVHFD